MFNFLCFALGRVALVKDYIGKRLKRIKRFQTNMVPHSWGKVDKGLKHQRRIYSQDSSLSLKGCLFSSRLWSRPERWIVTIPSSDQWLATIGNHWKTIATNGFWTQNHWKTIAPNSFGDQKPLKNHC